MRTHQAVRPSTAGYRLGRGHVRFAVVAGRVNSRRRLGDRCCRGDSGPRCARTTGHRQHDANDVHRFVHGVCQHRSGTITVDHVGRGEKRQFFFYLDYI